MMELGAVVCRPRAPACLACPMIELCATRRASAPTAKAAAQKKREIHYMLDYRDAGGRFGEVFLVQRPREASVMPSMWELPELASMNGALSPSFTLRHSITVTDYTVHVWQMTVPAEVQGEWIPVARLTQVALTGLAGKILRKARIVLRHGRARLG